MKYLIQFFLLVLSPAINAQEYSVSNIPDSLKENADVIKRFEEIRVTIKSTSKAVVKRKYIITVLNQNGDDWATYYNGYTNLISLSDISGKLYDAKGAVIKNVKKKEIADMSVGDDVSILSDARYKSYSFYHKTYPYTVEFEDEQVYSGLFFLPKWIPFSNEKMAIQESRFIIEFPIDYQLRYKEFNYFTGPKISNGKVHTYLWEIKNQKPIIYEVMSPSWRNLTPAVYIAASNFEFGEYKGSMSTWKSLGLFIKEINNGKDDLPEGIKNKVQELTANLNSIKDKTEALYSFLQKNTRYISIQLGIGSWQPFDAKYVASNKYGDCKALSNYMISLLKAAGIKANYVLIDAGENARELVDDFPSPMFNHAITCVPNGKDTIWLECTNQTVALGYMGTFTGNRKALLIDDDGGHVVQTPYYSPYDNQQIRKVKAVINTAGDLFASVNTMFTGEQQELQHDLIHESTPDEITKYLNKVISLPTYKVTKSTYSEKRNFIPQVTENLELEANGFAPVTGKRLFITPNLFNKSNSRLPEVSFRKYPLVFTSNYLDVDTINIAFPSEYTIESIPKSTFMKSEFGEYSISFTIIGNEIEMVRKFFRNKAQLSPEKYVDAQKFLDGVRKGDNSRVVLIKK